MDQSNENNAIRFSDLLEIASRRRWYLIIPFLVIVLGGMVLALTLPKMYQSRAVILVRTPNNAQNLVLSPELADIYIYVNKVSQQVMNRANLEKILNRFQLLVDADHNGLSIEEKIAILRHRITIEALKKNNRLLDAFFIAFKDQNPQVSMQVANTFASDVIAEDIKAGQENTADTAAFLADKQAAIKQKLEKYETALKKYRQKYMGGLPEQLEANLRALDRLQDQLMARRKSLKEAQFRLASVENFIADKKRQDRTPNRAAAAAPGTEASGSDQGPSLDQLKAKLAELQTRYTNKHPDIVHLKTTIAKLQAGQTSATGKKRSASSKRSAAGARISPELASYYTQRSEIENQILFLTEEIGGIHRQIVRYQDIVEETPRRQQELQVLKRNYDEARETYRSLFEKKLDVDVAVTIQNKKKRQQFVVIDPATVPRMPVEPDLKKLFAMTLAVAFAVGAGLVFLKEYTDTSFRKFEEVEAFLNVPLLAEVPILNQATHRRRKKVRQALTYVSILLTVLFLSSFAMVTFKGVDPVKTTIQNVWTNSNG